MGDGMFKQKEIITKRPPPQQKKEKPTHQKNKTKKNRLRYFYRVLNQTYKDQVVPVLHKLSQSVKNEERLPISF